MKTNSSTKSFLPTLIPTISRIRNEHDILARDVFLEKKKIKKKRERERRGKRSTKDKGETIDISGAIILLVGRFQGRWREGSTVWAGQTIAIKDSSTVENLPCGANPEKPSSFSLSLSLQRGGIRGKLYSGKLISIYDFVVWPSTMSVRYDRFYFVFNNNWKNCVSRPISRPLFPAYITSDIGVFPFFFFFVRVSRYRSPPLERRYYFR